MKNLFIIFIAVFALSSCVSNSPKEEDKAAVAEEKTQETTEKASPYLVSFRPISNNLQISENAVIIDVSMCCPSLSKYEGYYERTQNINVTFKDGDDLKKKSFQYAIRLRPEEASSLSDLRVSKEDRTKFNFRVTVSTTTETKRFVILETISETRSLFD
ncbi:MAG: hypothetical protein LBR70_07350 [Lactobacillaceae bacterium]|jgi:PBP1b-binding outer membrane lipoprotein LpoB|nr:hypothetical protein [Lactobacillaceae bacterium]